MTDESSVHTLQQELFRLQQEVVRLQREKADLEMLLEVAAEHSDYMEEELFQNIETTLRENEQRFRLISETVPVAIFVSRRDDHHIIYANYPASSLLGVPNQKLLGGSLLDVFLPEERAPLLQTLTSQGYLRQYEAQGLTSDGTLFWVLVSAQPLEFNRKLCLLSAFYDITRRKRNEERIHKLNDELEKRVAERTEQFYQANQRLQDTLTNLRDVQEQLIQSEKIAALAGLTAGVAHKLNTPTGVAITAGSFLLDKTREAERLYQEGALKTFSS